MNPDAKAKPDLIGPMERCAGSGRGCAPLRPVDARRGHKRIGHLYPPVEITAEMAKDRPDLKPLRRPEAHRHRLAVGADGEEPEPGVLACRRAACFTRSFSSSKEGKEAYVQPVIEGERYRFTVKVGKPPPERERRNEAARRGANFSCLMSRTYRSLATTSKSEGKAGRMGAKLMAIVAEGARGPSLSRPQRPSTKTSPAQAHADMET